MEHLSGFCLSLCVLFFRLFVLLFCPFFFLFFFPGSSHSRCPLLEPSPPPRPLSVESVCKSYLRLGCFGWKLSFFFFFVLERLRRIFMVDKGNFWLWDEEVSLLFRFSLSLLCLVFVLLLWSAASIVLCKSYVLWNACSRDEGMLLASFCWRGIFVFVFFCWIYFRDGTYIVCCSSRGLADFVPYVHDFMWRGLCFFSGGWCVWSRQGAVCPARLASFLMESLDGLSLTRITANFELFPL